MNITRALHLLPPEAAHRLAIAALGHGLVSRQRPDAWPTLATTLCGLALPNPLGIAAGFDKNAQALPGLAKLGFGFVEIGTVTPRPQPGNAKPRIFRLEQEQALINRLGFNNDGLELVRNRLATRDPAWGIVGANIGANRDSKDPIEDYVLGLRGVHDLVDYVTVNVSSPNTPGLRRLQHGGHLDDLLAALLQTRTELATRGPAKPIFLKVAPDLEPDQEREIAATAMAAGIDGMIISNTTVARPDSLSGPHRAEAGGLSGPPLMDKSTALLARLYRLTDGKLSLIGVGGIATGEDAYAKIRAGASALQLYTALIYQGPSIVPRVLAELDACLTRDGYANPAGAVGAAA
ncbi:MAG: quinone-dependent dihydroorotate dehydrogenase [Pseudomonadota bacterium]